MGDAADFDVESQERIFESGECPEELLNEDEELKPCPFCGAKTSFCYYCHEGYKYGFVLCGCGAQGPDVRTSYDTSKNAKWHKKANEEWNKRSISS